jgi:glycerol-3-phosphate dehydrogenase (NAD(P)+)
MKVRREGDSMNGVTPGRPVGVLGAGAFGTALAAHWATAGHGVRLWARREELARELREGRRNPDYLPDVELPPEVEVTSDLWDLRGCDPVVLAVPSHGFRRVLHDLLAVWPEGEPLVVVSAAKGIEPKSLLRMSEVTAEEAERAGREVQFAVLSGPSFAAELARGVATASVIASENEALARRLREQLASPTFRLYSSTDVVGVELGGTVKNVIAIAAGVVAGLKLGHNTLAALITRGLHEITRLGLAYGGRPRTFAGLATLGDLVLTCTGGLSRNRAIGVALAEGKTMEEVTSGHQIAEGVRNSVAIAELASRRGVEMPIVEQMVQVLYQGKAPPQALRDLMSRELKSEAEL